MKDCILVCISRVILRVQCLKTTVQCPISYSAGKYTVVLQLKY